MVKQLVTVLGFLNLLAAPVHAEPSFTCIRDVADQDLAAKVGYQLGLRDLFLDAAPEFTELAGLNARTQVAFAARRQAQLLFLMDRHPDQLALDRTLRQLMNFEWNDALEGEFLAFDETYGILSAEAETMRMKNDTHPDWPAMRMKMFTDIVGSVKFVTVTQTFSDEQYDAEVALRACRDAD